MKTHSVRPSQEQVGFIIDDQFVVKHEKYSIHIIHLNNGPKKPEEYKNYMIPGRDDDWNPYKILSKNIMCNEHIYIDIISNDYEEIYMRGFVTNILESDLNSIKEYLNSSDRIWKAEDSEIRREKLNEYMESVFGKYYHDIFYECYHEIYGIRLFENRIYLDLCNGTFAMDLSNVPLKDEFDQLIKANVDNIKKILFQNDISNDPKYSTY